MVPYDYASAGWKNIAFRTAPNDDRSARALLLPLTSKPEDNRARLERYLGKPMTGRIIEAMHGGQISGSYKEFNLVPGGEDSGWQWVLMLGLGDVASVRRMYRLHDRLRSIVASGARHFRRKNILEFAVPDPTDLGIDAATAARLIAEGVHLGTYRFERYKSPRNRRFADDRQIQTVKLLTELPDEVVRGSFELATATCHATYLARNLVNTPAVDLTPEMFARNAVRIAGDHPALECEILDVGSMEAERLNLHLAVGRGSDNPPCVAVVTYTPRGADTRYDLALVGKGVTFDTGGYNLKPGNSMARMYGDMAGGAAALGALVAIADLKLDLNVVAVIPLAENMVSGRAYRPSDILFSRKGLTVEVMNTDAEGRLLLADALTYTCERYRPRHLVDIATLTGSMRVALGNFVSGYFVHSHDPGVEENIANWLMEAGRTTGEWVWRFPTDDDYLVQLASDVADIENCETDSAAGAGAITAAVFLKQFVDFDTVSSWTHIDIAATAVMQRTLIYSKAPYQPKEGATGIGVRLLSELALQIVADRASD